MKQNDRPLAKSKTPRQAAPQQLALEIDGLTKTYSNGVKALDGVTLSIPTGMFGLLGPNGAGKSTLMRTVATLQEPDAGSVRLRGVRQGDGAVRDLDVLTQKQAVREVLGYLPQEFGAYPKTSALVMLDYLAALRGFSDKAQRREVVEFMLHRVNLYAHRRKAIDSYSGGMRQRFGIAQALIGDPKLLIVDEPTAGLDPGERNRFYNLLAEIGENIIVILSTHIVQDVRELCTSMAIINAGKVLFAGSPDKAESQLDGQVWRKSVSRAELVECRERFRVISMKHVAGQPVIHVLSKTMPDADFEPVAPGLEDVFFASTI
ncbi:MAG: ABC transporter ATP-binding protein [Planctomycetaceae bacterium]